MRFSCYYDKQTHFFDTFEKLGEFVASVKVTNYSKLKLKELGKSLSAEKKAKLKDFIPSTKLEPQKALRKRFAGVEFPPKAKYFIPLFFDDMEELINFYINNSVLVTQTARIQKQNELAPLGGREQMAIAEGVETKIGQRTGYCYEFDGEIRGFPSLERLAIDLYAKGITKRGVVKVRKINKLSNKDYHKLKEIMG